MIARAAQTAQENIEYYLGDNLFKVAWVGPYVKPGVSYAAEKMAEIERVFQGHNVVREVIDNIRNGLISERFTWSLKDSNGDRAQAEQAEIELQRWLEWAEQAYQDIDPSHTNFRQSDPWSEFVLSVLVTGYGALRVWQPRRYADASDPLHRIHLHVPKTGAVTVDRDDDGFIDTIHYFSGETKETHQRNADGSVTVLNSQNAEELTIDTGDRWLIQQVQLPSLITPSAKQKQGSICHALTMKLRNQELGGFKERTFLNAEYPTDADGNPIAIARGPGIDQYAYGIPSGDPASPSYTNPQLIESQPVPVQTFIDSIQLDRVLLYLEFRQGHLLADGDGGLSGESRIQMRQNFELYLRGWQRPIQSAIANVLNIVLRQLGYIDLTAAVELKITTGKLSPEERASLIAEFQAGLISRATTMAKLATVADTDAELALLEEEAQLNQPTDDTLPRSPLMNPINLLNGQSQSATGDVLPTPMQA